MASSPSSSTGAMPDSSKMTNGSTTHDPAPSALLDMITSLLDEQAKSFTAQLEAFKTEILTSMHIELEATAQLITQSHNLQMDGTNRVIEAQTESDELAAERDRVLNEKLDGLEELAEVDKQTEARQVLEHLFEELGPASLGSSFITTGKPPPDGALCFLSANFRF